MLNQIQDFITKRKIVKAAKSCAEANKDSESKESLLKLTDEAIQSAQKLISSWLRAAEINRDPAYALYWAVWADMKAYQIRRKSNRSIVALKAALIIEIYGTIDDWRIRSIVNTAEDQAKLFCMYYIELMRKENLAYSSFITNPQSGLPEHWGFY